MFISSISDWDCHGRFPALSSLSLAMCGSLWSCSTHWLNWLSKRLMWKQPSDSVSDWFNQIKGRDLHGKFEENDLRFVNIIGNAEVIHFVRDEDQALIGIEKTSCSEIHFSLRDGKIETSKFINLPDGQTYPPSKLPTAARKLRGFLWREAEKPMSKHDIFIKDEKWLSEISGTDEWTSHAVTG